MLSFLCLPKLNAAGNLLWQAPYLYPMEHLEEGILALRAKRYWVSQFPEGDGLAFTCEQNSLEVIIQEIRSAFPWMKIKEYNGQDFSTDPDISKTQLIIMPIDRLRLSEAVFTENISIFPAGEFILDYEKIFNLDGSKFVDDKQTNSLRDLVTKVTQVEISVFERLPVAVFLSDKASYVEFVSMTQTEDEYLIKALSLETEPMMNLIKFLKADYSQPEFLPAKAGIWNGRYSAALIYFTTVGRAHIISREVEYKNFIKGIGMDITRTDDINFNPITLSHIGETGKIVIHSLRLHAAIMETDNPTLKFTQIMTLFEYMAFPLEYKHAKYVKGIIALHIAQDKKGYHNFCHRFEELGAGLPDEFGKRSGLRTSIIHLGWKLEDLIPKREERDALFKELYNYVYTVLWDMFIWSAADWPAFLAHREELKKKLKV